MVEISELDVDDDAALRAFWKVGQAAQRGNLHVASLEINVVPSRRRGGIGRALHDEAVHRGHAEGRSTYIREVCQPGADIPSAGGGFATALGFVSAHCEDHLVLDLPAPSRAADPFVMQLVHEMQRQDPR